MCCQVPDSAPGVLAGGDDAEGVHRTGHLQAARRVTDRRHVVGFDIDESDVVAGALEECTGGTADRTRAPDQDPVRHRDLQRRLAPQPPRQASNAAFA